jgi:uncharacterized protein (DUF2249 family)
MLPTTATPSSAPTAIDDTTLFDVRPIPCRVKHAQIFQRWFDLPVGQHFVLLNDHDPVPLRYQLEAEYPGALSWEYLERGPDDFRVKITKLRAITAPTPKPPAFPAAAAAAAAAVASPPSPCGPEIDVRGLEPPEPLIRILGALETLPAKAVLRARTDRQPCHLFGEATQCGFRHESHEQPDGSWLTVLTRA